MTRPIEAIRRRCLPTTRNTRNVTVLVPLGTPSDMTNPERFVLRRESRCLIVSPVNASRGATPGCVPGSDVPVPVSGTAWGAPAASLVRSSVALRAPVAPGKNFNPMVHVPPGATRSVQLFLLIANSPAFGPEIAAPERFSETGPVFFSVRGSSGLVVVTFWLWKFTIAGAASIADVPPVPLSATGWVPPASVRSRLALSAPVRPGVDATSTVHVAPEASVVPVQVSALVAKLAASGPEIAAAVIGCVGARPVFLTVIVRVTVVPTRCVPKSPPPGAVKKIGNGAPASLPSTVKRFVEIPPAGSPGPVTRTKLLTAPTTV